MTQVGVVLPADVAVMAREIAEVAGYGAQGATFVIANSLTVSNKQETAAGRYNLRVVECRLAADLLALGLGLSQVHPHFFCPLWSPSQTLRKPYWSQPTAFLRVWWFCTLLDPTETLLALSH